MTYYKTQTQSIQSFDLFILW